jgi:hypothetical protein
MEIAKFVLPIPALPAISVILPLFKSKRMSSISLNPVLCPYAIRGKLVMQLQIGCIRILMLANNSEGKTF